MKITKREIMYGLVLLGFVGVICVSVWVVKPYQEKTDTLNAENNELAARVAELEIWLGQVTYMQDETERMAGEVNNMFARFPSESRSEDAIMYAVGLESANRNTYISSIGLGVPELAYESSPSSVPLSNDAEAEERTYSLYRQQITFAHEFTYNGMKQYVNTIVNDRNRKSIESMNIAYDNNTGILVGNTTMNLYTLTGTDREYDPAQIPSMSMGTSNIFGSLENPDGTGTGSADAAESVDTEGDGSAEENAAGE